MRTFIGAFGLLLCLSPIAAAQDDPRWQFAAGGSYAHVDVSPPLADISNIAGRGYFISVEEYRNRWFGGVAQFSDYYRQPLIDLTPFGFTGVKEKIRTHFLTLQLGPEVRQRFGQVTVFGRGTLGFARRIFKDPLSITNSDENAFAFGVGGGVDVKVYRNLAVRIGPAEYLQTRFSADTQSNWQVSAGLVFRFGER